MQFDRSILGKSEHRKTLIAHLIDTMSVCDVLMESSIYSVSFRYLADMTEMDIEKVCTAVKYLVGNHDIGKIHPIFQRKISDKETAGEFWSDFPYLDSQVSSFRHEKYSGEVLQRIWGARYDLRTTECLTEIISLHHQGKKGKSARISASESDRWEAAQEWHEQIIGSLESGDYLSKLVETASNRSGVCMTILGILVLSDWFASGEIFASEEVDFEIPEKDRYRKYYEKQKQRSNEAVRKTAFCLPEEICASDFPAVFKAISRERMRPLQTITEEIFARDSMPMLSIIEAPMGEGKTEAGLYAVVSLMEKFGKKGFYVGLPTSATANQMHGRVTAFLNDNTEGTVRLLHSMAWMIDNETKGRPALSADAGGLDSIITEWTRPLRRGLLETYSVGTIDQILMSALRVKYGVLRLIGAQNKVLLFDEVHAYDAYMTDILLRLLEWCKTLCIPVVMLSATLSTETKKKMLSLYGARYNSEQAYPAITTVDSAGIYHIDEIPETHNRREVQVVCLPILNDIEQIGNAALLEIKGGGNACVLVNTVKRAQAIYSYIRRMADDETQVIIYHARFAVGRRNDIEESLTRMYGTDTSQRPKKSVVICTQVVEQSLDVDFDVMLTDIAPIDLILQRSGRECRHSGTERPEKFRNVILYVLVPIDNEGYQSAEKVYPTILLKQTQKYLSENGILRYPESIRDAVEYVYNSNDVSEADLSIWADNAFHNQQMANRASIYELPAPDEEDFYIYQGEIFDDAESSSFLSAKTRLSEETTRIAMVDDRLFEQVRNADNVNVETAKRVLNRSVTYSSRLLKQHINNISEELAIWGKDYLSDVLILKCSEGVTCFGDGYAASMDDEIGFILEKEGRHGI